ncbi:hypothetical protein HALA3H3_490122 [Halomonas sp. A3H3]|nr:hypothetical protein HALA3H3_490122 [Halomonas sp. A3H3]
MGGCVQAAGEGGVTHKHLTTQDVFNTVHIEVERYTCTTHCTGYKICVLYRLPKRVMV